VEDYHNEDSNENTREAPPYEELLDAYYAAGLRLVPLKPENKRPRGNDWPKREIPRKEVERNLERGGGVGIQTGECSCWVCAVDLDHPLARKLAPLYLPETLMSGKEGEEPSHYCYFAEGMGFRGILDVDSKHVIDLKATNDGRGHQFVVEPSVHATKGPYRWVGGFDPAKIRRISSEELDRRVGLLGAATLIAMYYAPPGGRHTFGLALAGYLLRNGESQEDVVNLMTHAREVQPQPVTSETLEQIRHTVDTTALKKDRNENYTGGPTLEGMVPKLPGRLAKALGWESADTREGRKEYAHTDDGNALRFVDRNGGLIRYCAPWKSWLVWDGRRWSKDAESEIWRMVRATARSIHADAANNPDTDAQKAINKWAIQSQHLNRLQAMMSLARWDERVEAAPDAFDSQPWLFSAENGTIDLKTGELGPHDPDDLITRLAPVRYDPDAEAPRFRQFLEELFAGDAEVIRFVQNFAGYTLTGDTRERILAMLWGLGKNGKSTLVELLHAVLGDYAQNTDVETLLIKRHGGVGNDVAALKGARFVSAAEVEKGRQLAESKVKQLTGRDTVTARFLFGEFFDFRPEFKLWLSTNNKPIIRGTDDAIWDRIALIPFTERFVGERADTDLPHKLKEELSGVLAWMVEGCLGWQEHGLQKPGSVDEATRQYREEMDTLAAFFEDRCVIREDARVGASTLYERYRFWCEKAGEKAETQKAFGTRLSERGFVSEKGTRAPYKGLKVWYGIGLRVDDDDDDDDDFDDDEGENGPKVDDKIPPDDEKVDDGPPPANDGFAGDSPEGGGKVDDGRPFFHNLGPYTASRKGESGERSTSSTSSTGAPPEAAEESPDDDEWRL